MNKKQLRKKIEELEIELKETKHYLSFQDKLTGVLKKQLVDKQADLTDAKFEFLKPYNNKAIMTEAWYTKKIAEIQLALLMELGIKI